MTLSLLLVIADQYCDNLLKTVQNFQDRDHGPTRLNHYQQLLSTISSLLVVNELQKDLGTLSIHLCTTTRLTIPTRTLTIPGDIVYSLNIIL